MENNNFEEISFDYYDKTPSYMKMILDMIPERRMSSDKKYIVKELYNYYLNHYSNEKINEIIKVSGMFREKITSTDVNKLAMNVEYVYLNLLEKIIFNSICRDELFDVLYKNVKSFSGYYDEYSKNMYDNYFDIMTSYVSR